MEDGEIDSNATVVEYDPLLEWPGQSSTEPAYASKFAPPRVTLRLLVTQTSILPRRQKLVIIDGYTELQFGRDVAPVGTDTPRIRLKEMSVSKLHATVYWDAERREWGVVDMGSKHGTYIRPATTSGQGDGFSKDVRLSPSKMASVPRRLRHLDLLMIGSTSFLIHIHQDGALCIECSSGGGDEIPLFSPSKSAEDLKRTRDFSGMDGDDMAQRDPKKALTMLRRSLLTRHGHDGPLPASVGTTIISYVDRSARRRALHPGSRPDTPGISADTPSRPVSSPVETSQPSAPLLTSNIGHRLLIKQGWEPGTPLGVGLDPSGKERVGLVEPLMVSSSTHRQGVGMSSKLAVTATDWKEKEKQKRWDSFGW